MVYGIWYMVARSKKRHENVFVNVICHLSRSKMHILHVTKCCLWYMDSGVGVWYMVYGSKRQEASSVTKMCLSMSFVIFHQQNTHFARHEVLPMVYGQCIW